MAKIVISALVEGGKASAAPPLGPALGPSGLNLGEIIAAINKKTEAFAGMQVPVKVIVDKASRTFEIEVGTPPVSGLVKSKLGISAPVKEEAGVKGKKTIGNLSFDQLVSICKMKQEGALAKSLKALACEVAGTCLSMGVTIEGKGPKEIVAAIKEGKFDAKLAG
ncbi:MAG: 50S ribosomal protein L11 [Candidatus Micrarchaeota archaeon]